MGFIADSDVDEAVGLLAGGAEPAGAAVLVGLLGGCCDCEEATLLVADKLVPLVVGAEVDVGGLRLVVELFWVLVELLLVLRVEPTSLRKREFMDVDDIYDGDIIARSREGASSDGRCRCGRLIGTCVGTTESTVSEGRSCCAEIGGRRRR